jgi:hypothetical protein
MTAWTPFPLLRCVALGSSSHLQGRAADRRSRIGGIPETWPKDATFQSQRDFIRQIRGGGRPGERDAQIGNAQRRKLWRMAHKAASPGLPTIVIDFYLYFTDV